MEVRCHYEPTPSPSQLLTYLGAMKAPEGFADYLQPVFNGEHAWAVTRDALDVERVVRFRLEAPER